MKWEGLNKSTNVIDNRKKNNIIIGFIISIATLIFSFVYGPILPEYINSVVKNNNQYITNVTHSPKTHSEFIKSLLFITEEQWNNIFKSKNLKYIEPKLILFTNSTNSACGRAEFDVGPFYCSGDNTVYLDLDFFELMSKNLKVIGDASQAYIIFHEIGHHVQNLTYILPNVYLKIRKYPEKDKNKELVRLELQADCYAGIIFNKSQSILEPGDIEEIVNAAARIGDDYLQSRVGKIMPDTFKHGTSEQRAAWLLHGYKHGTIESCDTFAQIDDATKI